MGRALLVALAVLALAACGGEDAAAPTEPGAMVEKTETGAMEETETEAMEQTETDAMEKSETDAMEKEAEAEAEPGLPAALAGYETWMRLNAEPIPPRDADPHNGTKNVYASVAAVDGVYPDGAIVVKEATRPGADFIGLVAMMRKEAGANPEHNDWVMIEWTRGSRGDPFGETASGAVCTSCHEQARATDYVFTRR